jgi:hypothetical protein
MRAVIFGPENDALWAAGDGGQVRSWSLDPDGVAASICAVGGDRITESEWATHLPGLDYEPPC